MKLGNGKYKTSKQEKQKVYWWQSTKLWNGILNEALKNSPIIKTWTHQDLEIFFVKQICIEKEKAN